MEILAKSPDCGLSINVSFFFFFVGLTFQCEIKIGLPTKELMTVKSDRMIITVMKLFTVNNNTIENWQNYINVINVKLRTIKEKHNPLKTKLFRVL